MPTTLPVPSKGALRTLRSLALGTSCTVAFGAGLLTEERRRRIHAAREVHENAQKLKSSRKYHSAGTAAVAETFEEQVIRYRDDSLWQARETSGIIEPPGNNLPFQVTKSKPAVPPREDPLSFKISRYEIFQPDHRRTPWKPLTLELPEVPFAPPSLLLPDAPKISKARMQSRQQKLAWDVRKLLENDGDPSNVDAAASRFFDAFEEGLPIDTSGIANQVIGAAAQLSKACRRLARFEACEKILDIVIAYGPINEDLFLAFNPAAIIRQLISGPIDEATGHPMIEDSKLRKAAALYLTKYKEKPRTMSDFMRSLGGKLCAATCRYEMFDLTEAVYWRLEKCRGDAPVQAVNHLIRAAYGRRAHKKVVQLFRRFYTQTSPDQLEFYNIVGLVIESIFEAQNLELAEETLVSIAKMAEDGELLASTTWFLKVLGHDWRTHRDIVRSRAFFDRLEPLLHVVKHPQAVYGTIIQFCVESDDEGAAQSYYERLRETHKPTAGDVRIYGHFAYAKAMRQQWTGVKEDFQKMRLSDPDREDYSAAFTPIFNLFAKSHSVNETEEFLRVFIDQYGVVLTSYMSNTMINKYAQRREIDSIYRWLDYMVSVGCPVDALCFNTILNNCYVQWGFSFEEVHQLYEKLRKMEGSVGNFITNQTVSILRRIAIADSGQNVAVAVRKLNRLKLDQPAERAVNSRGIQEDMALALAKGSAVKALKIYKHAQEEKVPLHAATIATAVKASLRLHPENIDVTASLLQSSRLKGYDVSGALSAVFIHQISELGQGSSTTHRCIKDIARSTISALEQRGIPVPTHVVTKAMDVLVNHYQCRQAIEFWDSIFCRYTPTSLDLATLTTLLKAYIGLRDCVGVEWVVQMLKANDLIPDTRFKRLLKNTHNEAKRTTETRGYENHPPEFLGVIASALKSVSKMRIDATQEKENVKIKTIKIMEKAIEFQKATDYKHRAMSNKDGENPPGGKEREQNAISRLEHNDVSAEAWMESDEESNYDLDLLPRGRLVGISAG